MKKKSRNNQGFSLVEMSIIIAVFSVLLTSLLAGNGIKNESANIAASNAKSFDLEKALTFFQKANGFLPCPASRIAGYGTVSYGVSVSCAAATAAAAPAGTLNIGNPADAYQVRVGAIPTRTLGLPDDAALDPWGNRLSYVIIRSLGVDAPTYTAFSNAQATDLFQIINRSGTVIYGTSNAQIVKYALIGHGSDGKGAFNKNGVQGLACPAVADGENCNATKAIMQDGVNDIVASSNAAYYNDYVRYKPK